MTASCGEHPNKAPQLGPPVAAKPSAVPSTSAAPPKPALLPAHLVADIDDDKAVPYYAWREGGGLVVFASKGHLLARALGGDGEFVWPQPIELASIAPDTTAIAIRAVEAGYVVAWVEHGSQGSVLKSLFLDVKGKPLSPPQVVRDAAEELGWVDVFPNGKGALLMWATTHEDRSDLFAIPLQQGKFDGKALVVARDVASWEAKATETGVALALVRMEKEKEGGRKAGKAKQARVTEVGLGSRGTGLGRVEYAEVDAQGKAGAVLSVTSEPTAQLDVTLAHVGKNFVLAWTDERSIDPCVYLAVVEPRGKLVGSPHPATPPFGEQALVALVAEPYGPGAKPGHRALLAWEDQLRVSRDGRLIRMATVDENGTVGRERATMTFSASGPPDIAPDGEGFAAVTLAPIRDIPEGVDVHPQQGVKGDAPVWPAFVRFGPDLNVLSSEPIRTEVFSESDGTPYLTSGLSCSSGNCTIIGTGAIGHAKDPGGKGGSAPIALISLPVRQSPWKPAARREAEEPGPTVSSVAAVYSGEHLSKLAATELPSGGSLVAWVTYVLDAAAARGKAKRQESQVGATIGLQSIDRSAAPGASITISRKGVSVGGVALAAAPAGDGGKGEAALAWVTRDHGESQVVLTKVGPTGEKLEQKTLTTVARKKGGGSASEASDVAIAYAPGSADGWVTAWVDTRDGNAEVYAARVDRHLAKVVSDQRITNAPGGAAEVQVAARDQHVVLAWADSRDNPDEGSADIYVAHLDPVTLKKTAPETRVFASPNHSRTPSLVPTNKGFLLSWIEEPAEPKGGVPEADLRVVELDEKGAVIAAPQVIRASDVRGGVTSAVFACGTGPCRGVMSMDTGGGLSLAGFDLTSAGAAGRLKPLANLTGPASEDISPSFAGSTATSLFFADDSIGGTARIRWMRIAWP